MPADDGIAGSRLWRRWIITFLLSTATLAVTIYAAVVLIDPFSTGRFTLVQGSDIASRLPRLFKAGVARDPSFDAAIVGSSTGYPLDPEKIGKGSGWRVAQLAIPALLPPSQLLVARTFQRHHSGANLQIHILDQLWCRPGDPAARPWGPFPDWLYESSDAEYLSRILFPEGVLAAGRRVAIRIGLASPPWRSDGFIPSVMPAIPRSRLNAMVRPSADTAPDSHFPALDLLAAHIAALPSNVGLAFVFAPPYITSLPVVGSPADLRLHACKARARQIAAERPNVAWLDLMSESAFTRDENNYFDEVHYTPAAADAVAEAIVVILKESNLAKR